MMIRHILLKRKNNIGSVADIVSAWKVLSVFCIMFVLLIGCGEPNLDDPKVREKIIAEAINFDSLQTRRAPSGEELRYAPNQEQPYTGWVKGERVLQQYQNGIPNGIYISWYRNGQNSKKGTYRNGQKNGVWTEWRENGQRDSEGIYKNNVQNGMWSYWDEKRQKFWEIDYSNMDMDSMVNVLDDSRVREKFLDEAIDFDSLQTRREPSGEELSYAPNQEQPYTGWVKSDSLDIIDDDFDNENISYIIQDLHAGRPGDMELAQYQHGKLHGSYINWWNSNQQNFLSGTFLNGKLHGLVTTWYKNGQKATEDPYKNGLLNGKWTTWYKNGQKKWEGTSLNDKPDGLSTMWYENGQKRSEGTDKNGEHDGLWTMWYKNGQKELEGTYKNGKEDGLWTAWYENGRKWEEGTYKNGKEDGLWTRWDKNGQKLRNNTDKDKPVEMGPTAEVEMVPIEVEMGPIEYKKQHWWDH